MGRANGAGELDDLDSKDNQRRQLNLPWGIGIHGGDRGYESNRDDHNLDIGTPRHGEAVETNGEKETRIFSPGSAGKGMASSSSRISAHTNSAGRARYTM